MGTGWNFQPGPGRAFWPRARAGWAGPRADNGLFYRRAKNISVSCFSSIFELSYFVQPTRNWVKYKTALQKGTNRFEKNFKKKKNRNNFFVPPCFFAPPPPPPQNESEKMCLKICWIGRSFLQKWVWNQGIKQGTYLGRCFDGTKLGTPHGMKTWQK